MSAGLDLERGGEHYKNTRIAGRECIALTHLMSFSAGNVTKYIWRAGNKDGESARQDLEKALHYLSFLVAQYRPAWVGVQPPYWYADWQARAIHEGAPRILINTIRQMTFGLYESAHLELSEHISKEYA